MSVSLTQQLNDALKPYIKTTRSVDDDGNEILTRYVDVVNNDRSRKCRIYSDTNEDNSPFTTVVNREFVQYQFFNSVNNKILVFDDPNLFGSLHIHFNCYSGQFRLSVILTPRDSLGNVPLDERFTLVPCPPRKMTKSARKV